MAKIRPIALRLFLFVLVGATAIIAALFMKALKSSRPIDTFIRSTELAEKSGRGSAPSARLPIVPNGLADVGQSGASNEASFRAALALVDQGQWQQAEVLFLKILAADPNHENALLELAMIYMLDKHDSRAAIPLLERAVAIDPSNLSGVSQLLQLYAETGGIEEGLRQLEAMGQGRDAGAIDFGIGRTLVSMGRTDEALSHLEKAVAASNGQDDDMIEDLADALVETGDSRAGLDHYREVLDRRGQQESERLAAEGASGDGDRNMKLQLKIAVALIKEGETDEAKAIVDELGRRQPDNEMVASIRRELAVRF